MKYWARCVSKDFFILIYYFYFLLCIVCHEKLGKVRFKGFFYSYSTISTFYSTLFVLKQLGEPCFKEISFVIFIYYFYFLLRIVCRETSGRAMFQLLEPLWTSVSLLSFLSMMAQTTYFVCVGRFAYKRNLPPSLPPFLICVSVPSNCRSLLQDMWGIPQCPTGASNKPFSCRNIKCDGSATGMAR